MREARRVVGILSVPVGIRKDSLPEIWAIIAPERVSRRGDWGLGEWVGEVGMVGDVGEVGGKGAVGLVTLLLIFIEENRRDVEAENFRVEEGEGGWGWGWGWG